MACENLHVNIERFGVCTGVPAPHILSLPLTLSPPLPLSHTHPSLTATCVCFFVFVQQQTTTAPIAITSTTPITATRGAMVLASISMASELLQELFDLDVFGVFA